MSTQRNRTRQNGGGVRARLAAGVGALAVAGLALAPVALAVDPSAGASAAAPSARPSSSSTSSSSAPSAAASASPAASLSLGNPATPIEHLVVLMQENHTFDNYFGTYPGADGIPADVCMPIDPSNPALGCIKPHHLTSHRTIDLNHGSDVATKVENGGKYDNFVLAQNERNLPGEVAMGYYDGSDLPFYWNLASQYVLGDRFFSSDVGGSRENHMFWVAGQGGGGQIPSKGYNFDTIFDRLQAAGISWKFYVQNYDPSITYRALTGDAQDSQTIWVPLVDFDRFLDDPQLSSRIVDIGEYRDDLANGTLPAVSFMVPSGASEHPPGDVSIGQVYGASQVTALVQSSSWPTSAFVLTWDDWGGWYDHVIPPRIDANGYGLRVPALFVSPFTRPGSIDSTTYDFTSILKFIEDNWGVQPLTARDASANSIAAAFDFTGARQSPRLPEPTYPADVRVSPTARLALIAVYGLIVLGVPAGGFLAWRRRPAVLRPATAAATHAAVVRAGAATVPESLTASAAAALAATTIGASGPAPAEARRGRLLRRMPITAPPPVPARPRPVDPPATIPTRAARAGTAAEGAAGPVTPASGDTAGAPRATRPTRLVTAAGAPAERAAPKKRSRRSAASPAGSAAPTQPTAPTAAGPTATPTRPSEKSRIARVAAKGAPTTEAVRRTGRSKAGAAAAAAASGAPGGTEATAPDDITSTSPTPSAGGRRGVKRPAGSPDPAATRVDTPAGRAASPRRPRPGTVSEAAQRAAEPERPITGRRASGQPETPATKARPAAATTDEPAVRPAPAPTNPARRQRRSPEAVRDLRTDAPPEASEGPNPLDNQPSQTAESPSGRTAGRRGRSSKTNHSSNLTRRRASPPPEDSN